MEKNNTMSFRPHRSNAKHREKLSIPIVRGLPGIGVALPLSKDAIKFLSKTIQQYGDRVELNVLTRRVFLLSHPADIETVLITKAQHFGRSTEVKSLRPIFGDGLYSSEGDRWLKQRRIVQPAFHHERIVNYASTVIARMTHRTDSWSQGEMRDLFKEMLDFSSEATCEVLFGQAESGDAKNASDAASIVFENLRSEILYLSLWRRLPFQRNRRWNKAIHTLSESITRLIEERREKSESHDDLLGFLMNVRDERGDQMPDQLVFDEVMTMFVTGQETSGVALSWAIALLAEHSAVQEEAVAEIRSVTDGRPVKAEDYPKLGLLHAIVQESLRLYPPLWTIGRKTLADTMVGELEIPAGADVWLPVFAIQRDERWFPNAEIFDPSRWLTKNPSPKFSYFPFGGGARSCIAQHYALSEIVLGLAVILSRFRLTSTTTTNKGVDAWLTLRPKHGVSVKLEARSFE